MIKFVNYLILLLIFAIPFSLAASKGSKRFALIVGVNRAATSDLEQLRFADDDAVRHYQLLKHYTERSWLLTTMDKETQKRYPSVVRHAKAPSLSQFKKTLSTIFKAMEVAKKNGYETDFLFIYAGHGVLLSGNVGAITLLDGMLTRDFFYSNLIGKSPADFNHIIIDACNAYYFVNQRGQWKDQSSGKVRKEKIENFFSSQELSKYPGTGVILSTSSEKETHEWSRIQGGVFSYEVRSGMLGAADVNEDLKIEYSEMKAFLEAANHRITDERAKLKVFVKAPQQDNSRPLFSLEKLSKVGFLKIPKEIGGRFYIEDSSGYRYMDFNKTTEQAVTLTLLPSNKYFLKDQEKSREYLIEYENSKEFIFSDLQSSKFSFSGRGAVDDSFRKFLFAQPYGISFYNGIVAASGDVPVDIKKTVINYDEDESSANWKIPTGVTFITLGAGSVAGGIVTAVMAYNKAEDYRNALVETDEVKKYKDDSRMLTWISIPCFAAGAVMSGVGIWLTASGIKDGKHNKKVTVIPSIVPSEGGAYIGISGSW